MAEETKEGRHVGAIQLTHDNFDEADETDQEYGHLTAHLVESAPRKKETAQWTRVFARDEITDL